ncbi:DUF397 domain-containing protein [Streptomyces sp. ActVer]|uniref:DUF397 domain-containing protein n=1 Tax=Streptomyces sp. ActVer TaxID=3014558 RepID=UPI0022B41A9D|nr:DUF397 domain-containing protein [Streptomyces sp. ActVer]MCZ4508136.1 DUF397 domain-containing protein [Streptomyces sp. ActVer]
MTPRLRWQKSSFSEGDSENCIEVGTGLAGYLHLRESDAPATVLATSGPGLLALLYGIKDGRLNQASR